MESNNLAWSLVFILVTLILSSPTNTFAANNVGVPKGQTTKAPENEPYKVVNEFCSNTEKAIPVPEKICQRVLRLDPRSASATSKKNLAVIALDLTLAKTTETRNYFQSTVSKPLPPSNINNTPLLQSALKNCTSAYESGVGSLTGVPEEYDYDSLSGSYDTEMAFFKFQICEDSVNANKFARLPIFKPHRAAFSYLNLCRSTQN